MPHPTLIDHITADARRIHAALLAAPDAPVRHCPGWSVTDLVRHHGDVHRWAAAIVESGERQSTDFVGPDHVADLAGWYLDGADRLVEVLAATDPERACWTFGNPPHTARFWTTRQALEAAIHRWDAQDAAGAAESFPAEVAEAGISEVVDMFFPRQVRLERTPPLPAPVALRAGDLGARWTLPGASPGASPAAAIEGPAGTLLLLLWRRTGLDDPALTYAGPDALGRELRAARFAP